MGKTVRERLEELGFEYVRPEDENRAECVIRRDTGDGLGHMGEVWIVCNDERDETHEPTSFDDPVLVGFTDGDGNELLSLKFATLRDFLQTQ